MVVDNTTTEENLPPPHYKADTDPTPIQGNYGTGTGRATEPIEQPPTDSAPRPDSQPPRRPREKGREGEGRRRMLHQQQWQQQPTEPRDDRSPERKSEKSRPTSGHAAPRTTQPGQQLPPLPGSGADRRPLPTPTISDLARRWPDPTQGYSGRPDTLGDVLNLRIIYWNPGGITGKTQSYEILLNSRSAHTSYCWAKQKCDQSKNSKSPTSLPTDATRFPREGRLQRHSGSGPRDGIMHEAELTDFETMRSRGIRVGSEQRNPAIRGLPAPGTKMCVQDIHAIIQERTPTLIIGDLNAKHKAWGSHSISRAGRQLMEDAELQGYEVLGPDTPTHVPADIRHRPDVLDAGDRPQVGGRCT
ncbi:hypothetical protein EVAR_38044_1 [Eumeta japonica]|uniref:Endonuclease/exonuclease/phosphatase domain-containing protein n=1 Tax=Eumeta variegata TaxID=151549 RepID=A0A4C1W8Q0_EUMVA|nr:hypothetical protein EVAR_38044_1 [Eumeta japonica]